MNRENTPVKDSGLSLRELRINGHVFRALHSFISLLGDSTEFKLDSPAYNP